ncbi:MAG: hypothetical protein AAFO06_02100 [Cyanobacteria bacterium J06597_16]
MDISNKKGLTVLNTMWMSDNALQLNPSSLENALFFLDRFTYLDAEFCVIELVSTGMFDLSHPETAQELDLKKSLRAIKQKSLSAKGILKWIAENKDQLEDYPEDLCA